MPDINYPAIIEVDMVNYPEPTKRQVVKDTVILSDQQDLMALRQAIAEEREHATGKSVISLNHGTVDIGNIRNVHYNSLEQYKDSKGDKRFLITIKKEAVKGSVLVAPFFEDMNNRNRMFAYKNELLVDVYQKENANEAMAAAAEYINVGAEVLNVYRLF